MWVEQCRHTLTRFSSCSSAASSSLNCFFAFFLNRIQLRTFIPFLTVVAVRDAHHPLMCSTHTLPSFSSPATLASVSGVFALFHLSCWRRPVCTDIFSRGNDENKISTTTIQLDPVPNAFVIPATWHTVSAGLPSLVYPSTCRSPRCGVPCLSRV